MKGARKAFVTRIAKFTGIIPNDSYLKNLKGCSIEYKVMVWDQDLHKSVESPRHKLCVYVDKLKSGKYSIKIKQAGKQWKDSKVADLQEAFNPTKVQIKQRFYKSGGWEINVINFYSDHLLW